MDIRKSGRFWNAWSDGERCMGSLWSVGSEAHAVGFWWIDREVFDRLDAMDDLQARAAIRAGRCVYTFADMRSIGIAVQIFEADWRRLVAWERLPEQVLKYGECGDFVDDYPRGVSYHVGKERPLTQSVEEARRNVRYP